MTMRREKENNQNIHLKKMVLEKEKNNNVILILNLFLNCDLH